MKKSVPLHLSEESAGQPERSDAVANREHILAVTRRLFAEHGPEAVTMSDVVKAAEVGRGTLYRHFPNKGELCLAIMDERLTEFQNEVLEGLRALTAVNAPAMAQLDNFLDRLVTFTDMYTPLLREAQQQGLHYFGQKVGTPQTWQRATILGLLRTAVSQQEIAADTDVDYLADAILAPLNAQLFHYQRTVMEFSPERISAGLRAFVAQLQR
jgi:AcrR family transcriptional regulator